MTSRNDMTVPLVTIELHSCRRVPFTNLWRAKHRLIWATTPGRRLGLAVVPAASWGRTRKDAVARSATHAAACRQFYQATTAPRATTP